MKRYTLIMLLVSIQSFSQIIEVDYSNSSISEYKTKSEEGLEVFNKGFVDFLSSGSMQATAQIIKLKIGEPDQFEIPFYLFIGASGDSFGNSADKANLIGNLINPIGGILNGSINKNYKILCTGNYTFLKFNVQASAKLLSGNNDIEDKNILFGSGYGNMGLFFQTGAWEEIDKKNVGVFWLQTKLLISMNGESQLKQVFSEEFSTNNLFGYSFDLGIDINSKINLKAGVYQFFGTSDFSTLNNPIFKFSFDHKFN